MSIGGNLLEVRDLSIDFRLHAQGRIEAVRGVSFSLGREKLGIVGESGCGKSVTGLAVLRAVPSPPGRIENGRITFSSVSTATLNAPSS